MDYVNQAPRPPLPIPPTPCPMMITACNFTGTHLITITQKYTVYYEFDQKLKKIILHKCKCQYVPCELDLSLQASWYSQELNTHIFYCFNQFSKRNEYYIFDKKIGVFEQIAAPLREYLPVVQRGNKVAATIFLEDENEQEHVVIEAGYGEPPKKLLWHNGQYLEMAPKSLNTFLMREIQELENMRAGEDSPEVEEEDEEDRKFKEYFKTMHRYLILEWHDRVQLQALDLQTGLYTEFYLNGGFWTARPSNFNSIFQYNLSPFYMEKYDGKCVFHCRNSQFNSQEQYIFDSKQFVQVFYEELIFDRSKIQNMQHVFIEDGDAKFTIIIQNGCFGIGELCEVTSCFSVMSPRPVKTLAMQKAEKERRKKAKRRQEVERRNSGSDGQAVVPEKRRNVQGAQDSGATTSAPQNPLHTQPSSSSDSHNFAMNNIGQHPAVQHPPQPSSSCQCSKQSSFRPQQAVSTSQPTVQNQPRQPATNPKIVQKPEEPQIPTPAGNANTNVNANLGSSVPTVKTVTQPVQKPQQQPVNNNTPATVSQPAADPSSGTIVANGNNSIAQTGPQNPAQQRTQSVANTQSNNASTSETAVRPPVVTVSNLNAQPQQPAQVPASKGDAINGSTQSASSSVPSVKPATVTSNNSSSEQQQAVSTSQQTVQKPQQSANNSKSTVSQTADAPITTENVANGNSSAAQQTDPQTEKTVAQKQPCEIQKGQNGPQKPLQQQKESRPVTSTQSKTDSTSVTAASAHVVPNAAKPQQPAQAQVLSSTGIASKGSNRSASSSEQIVESDVPSNNSEQQQPFDTSQPTVQKPQQSVSPNMPTNVSQLASAPITAANVANDSSSILQNTVSQSEKTVAQKQACGLQNVQNEPEKPSQQQTQLQTTTVTEPENASTSVIAAKSQVVDTNNAQAQQPVVSQPISTPVNAASVTNGTAAKQTNLRKQKGPQKIVQQQDHPTSTTPGNAHDVPNDVNPKQSAHAQASASAESADTSSNDGVQEQHVNNSNPTAVSQPSSDTNYERNVTVQLYNSRMFWMGSSNLVDQRQNPSTSVAAGNAQEQQPSGLLSAGTVNNNSNLNATVPSNDAPPQQTASITEVDQIQPKQPPADPTIVQKSTEPQIPDSAESASSSVPAVKPADVPANTSQSQQTVQKPQQLPVNNCKSATVSQPDSSPSSGVNVANGTSSIAQRTRSKQATNGQQNGSLQPT